MHHESAKNLQFKETKISKDFTCEKLTSYSGLTVIYNYLNSLGLIKELDKDSCSIAPLCEADIFSSRQRIFQRADY